MQYNYVVEQFLFHDLKFTIMKKINERTFGSQLTNAKNMSTVVAGFSNYKPPRVDESVENFNSLIGAIEKSNSDESLAFESRSLSIEEKKLSNCF